MANGCTSPARGVVAFPGPNRISMPGVVQGKGSGSNRLPETYSFELYNIEQDPGEQKDIAAQHPEMVKAFASQYETWFDDVAADLQGNGGVPYPYELNPTQKQNFRFTWQCWFGPKAHWKSTAYGRWMMNNPGLIKRFDVTIHPQKGHLGKPGLVKFIWQGKTIEKNYDKIPERVVLENIELAEGTGFMEAQLLVGSKMWGVQEVIIAPHSIETEND